MAFSSDANSTTADWPLALPREQTPVPISLDIVGPTVVAFDVVWIVLLGLATGPLYDLGLGHHDSYSNYLGSGIAVALLYAVFAQTAHLYRSSNLLRGNWQLRRSILIWILVFGVLVGLVFLLKIGALFSRQAMLLFFGSGLLAMIAARLAVARVCRFVIASRLFTPKQVVLVGATEELTRNPVLARLEAYGYAVVRSFQVAGEEQKHAAAGAAAILAHGLQETVAFIRENRIDEVILAIPWNRPDLIQATESALRVLPVPVKLLPDTTTIRVLERPLFELGPTKVLEIQRAPLSAVQHGLKRLMDQMLAAAGIVLLLPLFAVIAAAIRLESPGPAMFMQMRVGFNGRPFRIYKFRTMSTLDDGAVVVQATKNDRRVTRLGRLLRKLSIDEIPQLLNVLRGEMSLVGPRPHALAHDDEYTRLIATYAIRHKMKPGITGWAQVNGFRGETPEIWMMEQRVKNDIWYIEYWSLWLDIRILLMTVTRALKSDNAY